MKRIIDGRKYDTETATFVASCDNGRSIGDFEYVGHWLYRKRTGEYFLRSEGGANTRYAVQDGTGWAGGSVIEPMRYDDARAWAEEHMGADEYEAEFGEVPESDGEDVVLSVRVSPATRERLRRMAAESGRSQGAVLDELVARA